MAKLKRALGCGCIIGLDYDDTLAVWYCPKHKAALDMYEALKMAIRALEDNNIDEAMSGEFEILTDAVSKAETPH